MDEIKMNEEEKTACRRGLFAVMSPVSFILLCVGVFSGAIHAAFYIWTPFADFFNGTVGAAFRFVLAKITSVFPSSLAELVLFCVPVILFLVLRAIWRYADKARHGFARSLFAVLAAASVMYSLFVFDFAAGYRTTKLGERIGIEVEDTDAEQLHDVMLTVIDRLNAEVADVPFAEDGSSVMPFSHAVCVERVTAAYDAVSEKFPFIPNFRAPVKRLAVSPIMTYTHISGVYSFYTGEANLNTNYPDFVNVFSLAHEMAHQRGIAREDEANFVAYLVLIGSSDPYLRYCGYMNMYEYLADALWGVSKDLYRDAGAKLSAEGKGELRAYSAFFEKYRNSTASKVAEKVNDSYLHIQGTPGTKSYGMVVDLAIAYHRAGN